MRYPSSLPFVVFVSGAVIMTFELVGTRVLAPYLGTSLFVWTSLIGVILASLSLGYWLGGRLADRATTLKRFSEIVAFPALFILITAFSHLQFLKMVSGQGWDLRLSTLVATTLLFAPASIILGMASPYAVRLKLKSMESAGKTVGNLYALSTLGSIVGTFLTGFLLLSYFGTTFLLIGLSLTLGICSLIIYWPRNYLAWIVVGLGIISLIIQASHSQAQVANGFYDLDTAYSRVWIYDTQEYDTGRFLRLMKLGNEFSSGMYLDSNELAFPYTRYYDLATLFRPDYQKALLLGGAGYSYPKHLLETRPSTTLDVVEIDPELTQLARRYFQLKSNSRLSIYHEDGRTFLNRQSSKHYQVIFGDAFKSQYSLPYQLTTLESVKQMSRLLDDQGVVLVNIISALEGEKAKFLDAEYATFKQVFTAVYLFPQQPANPNLIQNVMLVASKDAVPLNSISSSPPLSEYAGHYYPKDHPPTGPVLTDEFAPVDRYILPLLN